MRIPTGCTRGEWKADKWSRGGVVTYQGEKQCPWKRRMTKDGAHFARIIHTTKGFVIQKGVVALSHENGEELEDRSAIGVDDVVTNDGAGTSVDDALLISRLRRAASDATLLAVKI